MKAKFSNLKLLYEHSLMRLKKSQIYYLYCCERIRLPLQQLTLTTKMLLTCITEMINPL